MGVVELLLAQINAAPLFYTIVIVVVTSVTLALRASLSTSEVNPFQTDSRKRRQPPVTDKSVTDRVLKQGFVHKKVPEDLDAIVIGSGIGGLTTAAILAKAGKKVLVLEQHDQAGGCCHTFTEKGFEFDVGIHYVGKIHGPSFSRVLLDQISYGQTQWQALDDNFDKIVLDKGDHHREILMTSGDQLKQGLLDAFPEEHEAIDTFFRDCQVMDKSMIGHAVLKMLPMWLAKLVYWCGIIDAFTSYTKYSKISSEDYVNSLTANVELRAVLNYSYGDYGTMPADSSALMCTSLINHFKKGGGYPVGGASQIALNIIPVIESTGGRVLVRAPVTEILVESGTAVGVRVSKGVGSEPVAIFAPTIVSAAGVLNTKSMLPREVFAKSSIAKLVNSEKIRGGPAAISLFVGLNGSTEELGLKAQNIWAFNELDLSKGFRSIINGNINKDDMKEVPLLFLSFPSAKDPTWKERNPNKSTVTVITMSNFDWFKDWDKEKVKHRGQTYEELKEAIGRQMWLQVLKLYPQLEDRVEYFEVGSPLSNNYYIGSTQGEIYGLDHTAFRFQAEAAMKLRPDIGIPGLYLSGQDVMTCGFSGAMMGGLFCASSVLNRNVYGDCERLYKKLLKAGTVLDM